MAAFLDPLAVLEDRLQRLEPFERGVGAVALVLGEGDSLLLGRIAFLIEKLLLNVSGTISLSKIPAFCAAAVRIWL